MAAIATDRKAIVNKVNEAFANNDVEGFLALCASDVVWTMAAATFRPAFASLRQNAMACREGAAWPLR